MDKKSITHYACGDICLFVGSATWYENLITASNLKKSFSFPLQSKAQVFDRPSWVSATENKADVLLPSASLQPTRNGIRFWPSSMKAELGLHKHKKRRLFSRHVTFVKQIDASKLPKSLNTTGIPQLSVGYWPASRLSLTFLHSKSQALDVESRSCSLIDRRSWSFADFRFVVIVNRDT